MNGADRGVDHRSRPPHLLQKLLHHVRRSNTVISKEELHEQRVTIGITRRA